MAADTTPKAEPASQVAPAESTQASPAAPADEKASDLLAEIKAMRARARKAEEALAAAERARAEAEDKAAKQAAEEQGRWKELASKREAELAQVKADAEAYRERLRTQALAQSIHQALSSLGITEPARLARLAKLVSADLQVEWDGDVPRADFVAAAKAVVADLGLDKATPAPSSAPRPTVGVAAPTTTYRAGARQSEVQAGARAYLEALARSKR